jgi:hypothetical protein
MAYQIISGAPSGTYVFLAPLSSLKVLDALAKAPSYAEGTATKISDVVCCHLTFRVEPGMSWMSDEFASTDPEFWRGKPQ